MKIITRDKISAISTNGTALSGFEVANAITEQPRQTLIHDLTSKGTTVGGTSWSDTGLTIATERGFGMSEIIGAYVYLFGGFYYGELNTIYRAPLSDPTSWSNTGSTLPLSIRFAMTKVIGDYVYLFGGYSAQTKNTIYRAPISDPTSWSNTGSTLPAAIQGAACEVIGDYVYLFGGNNGSSYVNTIYRAPISDPTSWSNTGSTLPSIVGESYCEVIDDYVYLFGGNNGSSYVNTIYRAPISDPTSWSNTGSTLPAAIGYSMGIFFGDYVYLFGGNNGAIVNTIYRAPLSDPTSWSNTGSTLPAAIQGAACEVIGDYVYLFGGNTGGFNDTKTIYRAATGFDTITEVSCTLSANSDGFFIYNWMADKLEYATDGGSYWQTLSDTDEDVISSNLALKNGQDIQTKPHFIATSLTSANGLKFRLRSTADRKDSPYSGKAIYQFDVDIGATGRFEDSDGNTVNLSNHGGVFVGSVVDIAGTYHTITKIVGDGTGTGAVTLSGSPIDGTISSIKNPIRIGIIQAGKIETFDNPMIGLQTSFESYSINRNIPNGGLSYINRNHAKIYQGSLISNVANSNALIDFARAFRAKPFPVLIIDSTATAQDETVNFCGFYQFIDLPSYSKGGLQGATRTIDFKLREVI